jgi:hypothetical protein
VSVWTSLGIVRAGEVRDKKSQPSGSDEKDNAKKGKYHEKEKRKKTVGVGDVILAP